MKRNKYIFNMNLIIFFMFFDPVILESHTVCPLKISYPHKITAQMLLPILKPHIDRANY